MKRIPAVLFPLVFLGISNGPVSSQNLKIPVTNYTNKVYGRGYEADNIAIVTDRRNFIYAGNANGILEYDGTNWRFIPVRQGMYVTSLSVSESGHVYAGAYNEFGLLAPDNSGQLTYISLSDSLPEEEHYFLNIWKTIASDHAVYFQSEYNLFIYRDGTLKIIHPETSFHTSFLVNGKLYVRQRETGLILLENDTLIRVPGGELFANLGIFAMLPLDEPGKILIATQEQGFFVFDAGKMPSPITRIHTPEEEFLLRAKIYGGIKLPGGLYAFNTLSEGVVITDASGTIKHIINKNSGLQVNDVKCICTDRHGAIWCALQDGVSRIDITSPASFYTDNSGITGSVNSVIRYQGRLYLGTSAGLMVEKISPDMTESLVFTPVPVIKDQVNDLIDISGELVIGTTNALFVYKNNTFQKISDMNAFCLYYSPAKNILYAAGRQGLRAFRKSGKWKRTADFPDISEDIIKITPNPQSGKDFEEYWLGSRNEGVIRLQIRDDMSYNDPTFFNRADGLGTGWVRPFILNDTLLFGTSGGALAFVDEKTVLETLPDSLRNNPAYARGMFTGRLVYGQLIIQPLNILMESDDKTWMVIDNELSFISHTAPGQITSKPFRMIDMGEINCLFPDHDNILWLGTAEGLVRFDISKLEEPRHELVTVIRTVKTTGDSLLFNGAYGSNPGAGIPYTSMALEQTRAFIPVLDYSHNDLSISFSIPFYQNESENLYSWKMEGLKQEWTEWSDRHIAEYVSLREGNYEFRVKAKNIFGNESPAASYLFSVRPPWYRTAWAYIVYLLSASAGIYVAVRLGQYRLKKKNERLEQIVAERTQEIRDKNEILTTQQEEITDSIQYAERIQRAVLPAEDSLRDCLSEYFILLKPKYYVSGDFYWLAEDGSRIIIAAADCTGHGVPGAFMSMLGVSFLNKIIRENGIYQPDKILNELRKNIISALKSTGKEGEQKDGMDIALCVIDMKSKLLQFAGANNPLYLVHRSELLETRGDKMPVAYYPRTDDFSIHTIQLESGDVLYLFSDGFADQFGGPNGKKFMHKQFRELLATICDRPMAEQKQLLEKTIKDWMSPAALVGAHIEQTDDILVIGIRI